MLSIGPAAPTGLIITRGLTLTTCGELGSAYSNYIPIVKALTLHIAL